MRLILIIVGIVALGFYGCSRIGNKDKNGSILQGVITAVNPMKGQSDEAAAKAKELGEKEKAKSGKGVFVSGGSALNDPNGQGAAIAGGGSGWTWAHSGSVQWSRRLIPVDTSAAAAVPQFPGVTVLPDPGSNTWTVIGENELAVKGVLAALRARDVDAMQCGLRVWAVFVDDSAVKGFDLAAAIGGIVGDTSLRVGADGGVLRIGADDMEAVLRVICDDVNVQLVQRPFGILSDGVPLIVEATQEFPIPNTAVSNGVSQSSVQYRKVGLVLNASGRFLGDGRVVLAVEQSNGLVGREIEVAESRLPVVESQRVSSSVRLEIGQSVVLGGVRSMRKKRVKGLLSSSEEIASGWFYVVLAVVSETPRAVPVRGSVDTWDPSPPWSLPDPNCLPGVLPDK